MQELAGRRGLGLLVVTALLLGSVTLAPNRERDLRPTLAPGITVGGDAPPEVVELKGVAQVPVSEADLIFERAEDGTLLVQGTAIPKRVREALDHGTPAVERVRIRTPWNWPGRSLLLALLATSAITGALSESVGGERSRNTLDALLTAAVTRWEVVLGKWLAWTAFGAGTGMLAALSAVALGRQPLGLWLLALPFVPASTVALGFAMNRQVRDVLTGATVSMRWLPVAVSSTALLAWQLGRTEPILGALIPLGGALIATGGTWEGWAPTLLACASSGLFAAGLLWLTVRDLGTDPAPQSDRGILDASGAITIAAIAWWTPVLAAQLWGPAGNPAITDAINPAVTVFTGAAGLALLAFVRMARGQPAPPLSAAPVPLLVAAATGIALGAWAQTTAGLSLSGDAWPVVHRELVAARVGTHAPVAVLLASVAAQELLFRGWLQRRAGVLGSVLAWTLVVCPTQPLIGVVVGLLLATASASGGITASALLHAALLLSPVTLSLGPVPLLLAAGAFAAHTHHTNTKD